MSTKGNVLKALEENKGITVSGEELASRLSISRAAIWKAIQELRKEGYRIDAITNKGYCLSQGSDVLSVEGILPHVKERFMADRIHVFKSLESTNLTAKKMALDGASPGTVVIAEEQTKGRGRMGRSFYSPPAGGIYMSFILEPRFDTSKSVLITTAASVAVCKAIEKVTGISCRIKWVNDVYMGEKKICGILTEAVTDFESGHIDYIVLGIGINYSTARTAFPEELTGIAGSLFEEEPGSSPLSDDSVSRNRLIAEVINQVLEINEDLESRKFIDDYKSRSFVLGKEILIITTAGSEKERNLTGGIPATAVDIDGDGGLVVQYRDGSIRTLNSGEISIRAVTK
ncbi:MAG TPA: biotin--[acetyl-CoA-carboxylase] ligase [Anaerovoracaceae bacterium]|nr:biotin--[acetyl-CoA-carboxylase] ligase [Anaerovoracaceae bacterium]